MSDFADLSVSGVKAAATQDQRKELQEKMKKRQEEERMKQQMAPAKQSAIPVGALKALNEKIAKQAESKDRIKVINISSKIDRYYKAFGETSLAGRKRRAFTANTTLQEAEEELASVQAELASGFCYQNCENLFLQTCDLLETVGPQVGVQTQHLGEVMKDPANKKVVEPELLEISITYDWWFQQGPVYRLAQKMFFMIKKVHEANRKFQADKLQEDPPANIETKYAEL